MLDDRSFIISQRSLLFSGSFYFQRAAPWNLPALFGKVSATSKIQTDVPGVPYDLLWLHATALIHTTTTQIIRDIASES